MSRYKFLGVNDDKEFCMCCGREGLKRVVWIEDIETGDINHYGTTCATSPAHAFGHKVVADIRSASSNFERRMREARNHAWWIIRDYYYETMFIKGKMELTEEGKREQIKVADIYYRMTFTLGAGRDAAMEEYSKWVFAGKDDKMMRRLKAS